MQGFDGEPHSAGLAVSHENPHTVIAGRQGELAAVMDPSPQDAVSAGGQVQVDHLGEEVANTVFRVVRVRVDLSRGVRAFRARQERLAVSHKVQ